MALSFQFETEFIFLIYYLNQIYLNVILGLTRGKCGLTLLLLLELDFLDCVCL